MCRRIDCATCGRPSYAGCGLHVEQVLKDVPPEARCHCREQKATEEAKAPQPAAGRSWLRALIGK